MTNSSPGRWCSSTVSGFALLAFDLVFFARSSCHRWLRRLRPERPRGFDFSEWWWWWWGKGSESGESLESSVSVDAKETTREAGSESGSGEAEDLRLERERVLIIEKILRSEYELEREGPAAATLGTVCARPRAGGCERSGRGVAERELGLDEEAPELDETDDWEGVRECVRVCGFEERPDSERE